MGWTYNGTCHTDIDAALSAFRLDFPRIDGGLEISLGSSVGHSAGAITYDLATRPLGTAGFTYHSGQITLAACEPTFLAQYPIQDLLFPLSFLFALFSGFKTGFRP